VASGLIATDALDALVREADPAVLDVRGMAAYLKGHIPGAVSTRWQDFLDPDSRIKGILHPDSAELARRFGALGVTNDRPVVVYSEPFEYWGAEGRFFWMLHYLGHDDVRVLDGGFPKWRREGRDVAHMPTRAVERPFTPIVRLETLIDREGVESSLEQPGAVIVDARSSEEFEKEGRVPGAVSLPWSALYTEDGTVRPEPELRALLEAAGVTPDREIVPYCTGGVRSAWLFTVLHLLGYPRLRNYDGSWWDWTHDGRMPIERDSG
jgi:thiosulfate/3-mercaptopyruvate sulfurtransferase